MLNFFSLHWVLPLRSAPLTTHLLSNRWEPGEVYREAKALKKCYYGWPDVESADMMAVRAYFFTDMIAITRIEITKVAPIKEKTLHYDAQEHGNSSIILSTSGMELPLTT